MFISVYLELIVTNLRIEMLTIFENKLLTTFYLQNMPIIGIPLQLIYRDNLKKIIYGRAEC